MPTFIFTLSFLSEKNKIYVKPTLETYLFNFYLGKTMLSEVNSEPFPITHLPITIIHFPLFIDNSKVLPSSGGVHLPVF